LDDRDIAPSKQITLHSLLFEFEILAVFDLRVSWRFAVALSIRHDAKLDA
jgi:hypothetical protein